MKVGSPSNAQGQSLQASTASPEPFSLYLIRKSDQETGSESKYKASLKEEYL